MWQFDLLQIQALYRETFLNSSNQLTPTRKPSAITPPRLLTPNTCPTPNTNKVEPPVPLLNAPDHKSQILAPQPETKNASVSLQSIGAGPPDEEIFVASVVDGEQNSEPHSFELTRSFKLPVSKSPVMESMVFCALNKWFIHIKENDSRIVFQVADFHGYFRVSSAICSKHAPSDDIRSRMKALQRWFVTFPSKQELHLPFELIVRAKQFKKVKDIIKKMGAIQSPPTRRVRQ